MHVAVPSKYRLLLSIVQNQDGRLYQAKVYMCNFITSCLHSYREHSPTVYIHMYIAHNLQWQTCIKYIFVLKLH